MSDYMNILKMIESGEISPDEGAELLQQIGQSQKKPDHKSGSLEVLEQLDRGELNTDQAVQLLALEPATQSDPGDSQGKRQAHTPPDISDEELRRWQQWWTIPLYAGIGIVVLSTLWINTAYQNSGYGFWFFFAWLPLTLGVFLMALSWRSRTGPWIHIRVNSPNERIAISIPIPLGLTAWALRNFGNHLPHLKQTSVDEILIALEQTSENNTPLYVHVDESADGEQVEVFIG